MKIFVVTVLLTVILAEISAYPLGGPHGLEKRNIFGKLGKKISKGWDKVEDLGDKVVDVFKGKSPHPPPAPFVRPVEIAVQVPVSVPVQVPVQVPVNVPVQAPVQAPVQNIVPVVVPVPSTTITKPAPVVVPVRYDPENESNQYDRPEESDHDDEARDAVPVQVPAVVPVGYEPENESNQYDRPEESDHDDEDRDAVPVQVPVQAPVQKIVPVVGPVPSTITKPAPVVVPVRYDPENDSNQYDRPEELVHEGFDPVEFDEFGKPHNLDLFDFEEEGSVFPDQPRELDLDEDEDFGPAKFDNFVEPRNIDGCYDDDDGEYDPDCCINC